MARSVTWRSTSVFWNANIESLDQAIARTLNAVELQGDTVFAVVPPSNVQNIQAVVISYF